MSVVTEFCEHDHYTTAELVEQLGVARGTIDTWRRSGKIPIAVVMKRKGRFYFHCKIIDMMIDAGLLEPDVPQKQTQPEDNENFAGLKRHKNVALLPFHFNRYMDMYLRRQAGCLPKGPAGVIRRNY